MARINLKGMGVALVTPFKQDKSIDFDALARLLEYQIKSGVDYLVVLGTTAETATLTPDEKHRVRDFVVERVAVECRSSLESEATTQWRLWKNCAQPTYRHSAPCFR